MITAALLLLVGAVCAQDALGQLCVVNIPTPQDSAAIPLNPDTTLPPSPVREQWTRMIANAGSAQIDARSVQNMTRPTMFVALALADPLIRQQRFGHGRPGRTTTQMLGAFVAGMDAIGWLRQGNAP